MIILKSHQIAAKGFKENTLFSNKNAIIAPYIDRDAVGEFLCVA